MWAWVELLAKYCLCPFEEPSDRSNPNACRAATLTAEKWPHVCKDGVAKVEYHLEGSDSEHLDGKTGSEPFGIGQISQNLRDGFSSELHRAIGHQDMDRLIGIPNIEAGMK
jgi:hypothetical protein